MTNKNTTPNAMFDALLAGKSTSTAVFMKLPDGTEITYADTVARAGQMASVLADEGVTPGDRILVQAQKSPDMLMLYLASIIAGSVFVPLNTGYTAAELAYFMEDADPALMICDAGNVAALEEIAAPLGVKVAALNGTDGSLANASTSAAQAAPAPRGIDDLAAILYTSGTTGRSKGAMLTHGNLLSNAESLAEDWRFTSDDVLLHALPIFHTHGLFVATNVTLAAGSKMIFMPKLDLDELIRFMPEATCLMGVPTFYTRILSDERITKEMVAHMRVFISGSAPLLEETHKGFTARFGHNIVERYGMTETNMIASNPYDGARKPGTVGFALPGVELRLSGDEAVGGIELKGPNVTPGYWRNQEKTDESFTEDGFFITGDLGSFDDDGYLCIVGRQKDLVISGGYNVYPKEVELEIDMIPGVVESAVFGVAHPDLGEGVTAAIVVEPGNAPDTSDVKAALADKLAKFKQPKAVITVDELPRNTMGKVQKNLLRDEYAEIYTKG